MRSGFVGRSVVKKDATPDSGKGGFRIGDLQLMGSSRIEGTQALREN